MLLIIIRSEMSCSYKLKNKDKNFILRQNIIYQVMIMCNLHHKIKNSDFLAKK